MTPRQKEFIKLASQPGASILRIYGPGYTNVTWWQVRQSDGKWQRFAGVTGDALIDAGLLRTKNGLGDMRGPIPNSYIYEIVQNRC